MKLSRGERLLLANQYQILEAVGPQGEREAYARFRDALEHGYEGLDVALLPGSNVALDESALSIRGQAGRVRRRGLVHPGPRPLKCAVGSRH